tara:strand:+ start:50 stop:337 length:288 start_codon:yes stop_codon:yes gene_type:complete
MNNIYLHSDNQPKGILKEDVNKKAEVVSSILPAETVMNLFKPKILLELLKTDIHSKPVDRLAELKREAVKNFSTIRRINGFSCLAEFNYYHNVGG